MSSINVDTDVIMEDAVINAVAREQQAASLETTSGQQYIVDMDGVVRASAVPQGHRQYEPMVGIDDGAAPEIKASPKSLPRELRNPTRTGLCYDARMRMHATVDTNDIHPEDPRRIAVIYDALVQAGLVNKSEVVGRDGEESGFLYTIAARMAERDEITLNHTDDLYDFIKSTRCKSRKIQLYMSCSQKDLCLRQRCIIANSSHFLSRVTRCTSANLRSCAQVSLAGALLRHAWLL